MLLLSHSVVSDSLWPHGLQHTRLSVLHYLLEFTQTHLLSQWWHPAMSSSVIPFFSCLQSFPASGSFPMTWLFTSHGLRIGASTSASALPMNIQSWLPLGLTGLISLLSKGLSRVFSAPQFKSINSSALSLIYGPALTSVNDYWKNHSFDYTYLCWQTDVSAFWCAV